MPRAPNCNKRRGAETELLFLHEAWKRGLTVAHPYGDLAPYDFIVDAGGTLKRVQVRLLSDPEHGSTVGSGHGRGQRKPYTKAEIDVLAVYAAQTPAWYLIPVEAFAGIRRLRLAPHLPHGRGKFEKWRDAWHTLTGKKSAK
ncbi:MAG: group I intron-associated PD-(D/E)XK endonuclease [Terriglobales bacterium]